MASEFTRKIQRIKDILTFNSILADDGDILLTKSGEVYTQVNGKVKQLSNPNYGAGNVNKILAVSGTGEVVPIQMPSAGDILSDDNTFTGENTFSKDTTFGKASMFKEEGGLEISGNTPYIDMHYNNSDVDFTTRILEPEAGVLSILNTQGNLARLNADFVGVLHDSGNETVSGDKTFNGQTTLLNGNFGLRVTNSGIVKTTDAGKTWVAL